MARDGPGVADGAAAGGGRLLKSCAILSSGWPNRKFVMGAKNKIAATADVDSTPPPAKTTHLRKLHPRRHA